MAAPPAKQRAIASWLLPATPAGEFFAAVIARLAAECEAPVFQPHLTLGVQTEGRETLPSVEAKPIALRIAGIDWSEQFTKTLFVRFEITPELQALRESLGVGALPFDPHVSLLYCNLPMAKKEQLASSIALPFSVAIFDTIQLVRCVLPVTKCADVGMWQVMTARPLEAAS